MRHQGKAERDACYEPMKKALEECFEGRDRLHFDVLVRLKVAVDLTLSGERFESSFPERV